jgi:hypothetical protein
MAGKEMWHIAAAMLLRQEPEFFLIVTLCTIFVAHIELWKPAGRLVTRLLR